MIENILRAQRSLNNHNFLLVLLVFSVILQARLRILNSQSEQSEQKSKHQCPPTLLKFGNQTLN